jgi:K+/H+ antiporter YhaU regulatory subunit KhtT
VSPRASKSDREKIMQIISDSTKRKDFKADRKKALQAAGVSADTAAKELADILAAMSDTELDAIAKLNQQMVDLGYTEQGSRVLAQAV